MNYVARITLDHDLARRQRLFSIYAWHKEVWKLFPCMPDDERDFLFRLDASEDEFCLTVTSKYEPKRPPWCPGECWLCRPLGSEYLEYKKYLFKLSINPTRTTRKNPDGTKREKKYGRHEAILKIPELREWFNRKAERCGFRILENPPLNISPPTFHGLEAKDHNGTIVGVDFKGALEVTDRKSFKEAFEKGIGRARSFGFGLLVLRPIE